MGENTGDMRVFFSSRYNVYSVDDAYFRHADELSSKELATEVLEISFTPQTCRRRQGFRRLFRSVSIGFLMPKMRRRFPCLIFVIILFIMRISHFRVTSKISVLRALKSTKG